MPQVQVLGLAPEAWSGQSNRRAAFIGIMWKQEQILQSYHTQSVSLSNTEQFEIFYTNNYEASRPPQAQGFRLVTQDPFLVIGLGLTIISKVHPTRTTWQKWQQDLLLIKYSVFDNNFGLSNGDSSEEKGKVIHGYIQRASFEPC